MYITVQFMTLQAVSLLSTMNFQPDYIARERFRLWEQHIENTVRRSGEDRNRQVAIYICHDHDGSSSFTEEAG